METAVVIVFGVIGAIWIARVNQDRRDLKASVKRIEQQLNAKKEKK